MTDVGLRTEVALHIADTFWSCFIVTPLTIFYWGGTWKLLDLYLFPDDGVLSAWVSLAIGTTGCLSAYLFLPMIGDCLQHHRQPTWSLIHVLLSRLCIYILGFAVLNYWRGIWNLMDTYIGTGLLYNSICVAVSAVVLVPLRATSTVIASPYVVEVDIDPHIYHPITRFKTPVRP